MSRERAGRHDRRERSSHRVFVVTGKHAVLEAIAGGRAREVVVDAGARADDILAAAGAAGVPVRSARGVAHRPARGDREGADGVSGRVELLPELSERDIAQRSFAEDAIVVVLDGITDPQNLGAAARSAEAAGAALLVTRQRRAAPVTPAAVRASAGALLHLPLARVANIPRALERLQAAGFTAIGLDERAPGTIYDAPAPEGRIALVVGAEDRGLSRLVAERCDELRALPMRGRVVSLNASAALSAALFGFVLPARGGR